MRICLPWFRISSGARTGQLVPYKMLDGKTMKLRHIFVAIACGVLLRGGAGQAIDRQSEIKVQQLMRPRGETVLPPNDRGERVQRARRLLLLWQSRNKKDITFQVVPFLQDRDVSIRESAVRVLVRLRNQNVKRTVIPLLRSFLAKPVGQKPIDPWILKLALGYNRSRDLQGQKRLDAFAQSVGLTWRQVVRLSQVVDSGSAYMVANTVGQEIMDELMRVLTEMGHRGEDIKPFYRQLSLTNAQNVLLRTASLKPTIRVTSILNYLARLDVVRDDELLSRQLVLENSTTLVPALA
ncbi:hypothetical protein IAD21_01143 [Abditibacteriota bacterium]|nr:hypothetical protein IAD21_01143 [Abditibacteriota bacterium]